MGNPKAAVEAVTACGERVGDIVLHELTIGRVALLERIGSPFAKGRVDTAKVSTMDIIQVGYVLSSPISEVMGKVRDGAFETAAVEWADTFAIGDIGRLSDAMARIFKRVEAVAPSGGDDDVKKPGAATGG